MSNCYNGYMVNNNDMDGWMDTNTNTNIVGMAPTGLQEIFSPAIVRNKNYQSIENLTTRSYSFIHFDFSFQIHF